MVRRAPPNSPRTTLVSLPRESDNREGRNHPSSVSRRRRVKHDRARVHRQLHAELINYLAPKQGVPLFEDSAGPVRTGRFEANEDHELFPDEIVARGWE
jgi:hypothetical protein